jgi:hypothetical protein
MIQATCVYSTPPTNTSAIDHPMMFPPVDPTRRRFLAVAAVASVVSAGTLAAAAAMDPNVPAAVTVPRHSRPDPVLGLIEAYRKAEAAHRAALDEQNRLEKISGLDASDLSEQPCHDEFDAFDALLSAEATTVPGIVAQLAYLQEIGERNAWMFNDREESAPRLLKGFAASIANVLAVQSRARISAKPRKSFSFPLPVPSSESRSCGHVVPKANRVTFRGMHPQPAKITAFGSSATSTGGRPMRFGSIGAYR